MYYKYLFDFSYNVAVSLAELIGILDPPAFQHPVVLMTKLQAPVLILRLFRKDVCPKVSSW
jgi:hypothetical protein